MSEPWEDTGWEGGFLCLVGRDVFRAFKYKPQALQIVDPFGDRRQRGVCVVPQLLYTKGQCSVRTRGFAASADGNHANLQTCPKAGGLLIGAYCDSACGSCELDCLPPCPCSDVPSPTLTPSFRFGDSVMYSSVAIGMASPFASPPPRECCGRDSATSKSAPGVLCGECCRR